MGIVRDLYYARKMSAGLKLPAPTVALLIKRLRLAAAMGGGIEKTVSGSPAHITDALAKAALSVLVSIEPIQDLHGYDSPWPAGGGVNKFYCSNNATATAHGVTCSFDASTQTFTVGGTNDSSSAYILLDVTPTAEIARNKPISRGFIGAPSGIYVNFVWYDGSWHGVYNGDTIPDTVELSNIRVQVGVYGSATNIPSTTFKFQIQEGSTAPTSWSPYSNICPITGRTGVNVYVSPTQDPDDSTVYNVDWTTQAGTVYGGTLDAVTGELVVDRGCVNVSSSWYWNKSGSYPGGFYVDIQNAGTGQKKNTPFICSHAKTATSISQYVQGTCFCDGSISIRIMDGSDTVQDWEDYINAQSAAGTPIQICYELATPLTYQLTPQEVQMLLGENNVWSSSGDTVSVTYYAEGNANPLQSLNILLGGNYSNPKTADDVSDKEALEIILGGNK